jgi:hypothetical protein
MRPAGQGLSVPTGQNNAQAAAARRLASAGPHGCGEDFGRAVRRRSHRVTLCDSIRCDPIPALQPVCKTGLEVFPRRMKRDQKAARLLAARRCCQQRDSGEASPPSTASACHRWPAARALQAGALLTNHIALGRRTLAPSRCVASASRTDAMAAATTSAGWPRSQLLTAPSWVD